MCTRKKEITLQKPDNLDHIWKMPKQLASVYEKGGKPKMMVKCGKCFECKSERARNWTYKIWLESLDYEEKCMITLTYRDIKKNKGQLEKKELQKFIKKLRKKIHPKKIKYFAAGEYGEEKGRPHYHIIILGWIPENLNKNRKIISKRGYTLYLNNKTINELWNKGRTTVQKFHPDEIGYLTLYLNYNAEIKDNINKKPLKEYKKELNKLQYKYGIMQKYADKKGNIKYAKYKAIKDLTPDQYKEYKKEYRVLKDKLKLNKEPEFNLSSTNMGFENYIKKKYYKYDLVLDNYIYEKPKEYIRKIYENLNNYDNEVIKYTIKELLERKKYAEENYINPEDIEERAINKTKEREQVDKNNANKILYKHIKSDF